MMRYLTLLPGRTDAWWMYCSARFAEKFGRACAQERVVVPTKKIDVPRSAARRRARVNAARRYFDAERKRRIGGQGA